MTRWPVSKDSMAAWARVSSPATVARYRMPLLLFDRFLKATERKGDRRILTTEVMQAVSVWGIQAPRLSTVKRMAAVPFMAIGRASTETRSGARCEEARPSTVRWQISGREAVE